MGAWQGLKGGKERGKLYNYIIILRIKIMIKKNEHWIVVYQNYDCECLGDRDISYSISVTKPQSNIWYITHFFKSHCWSHWKQNYYRDRGRIISVSHKGKRKRECKHLFGRSSIPKVRRDNMKDREGVSVHKELPNHSEDLSSTTASA